MKALKFYNERLYVTRLGNVYGVRQVGEYMYQIMCYTTHKLVYKGKLMTIEEVDYCLLSGRGKSIIDIDDLFIAYDLYHKNNQK